MKNKAITNCVVLSLFFSLLVAYASADVDDFRGMRWGTTLAEIQRTKKLTLTKKNGPENTSLYSLENEELRYGDASLTGIHCSFSQDRLQGIILIFQGNKNFTALKAAVSARFGTSKSYGQGKEEMYNWVGNRTNTVLSYDPATQAGFLFMKQKTPEEQAQTVGEEEPTDHATEPARVPDNPIPPPENAGSDRFSPEIQGLLDRDQALTNLCWGTPGPGTEEACRQMREGVERLKALGMCMTPRDPGPDVIWSWCQPQAAPVPRVVPGREEVCHQIEEMFISAAELRDNDDSPQIAEQELAKYQAGSHPEITTALIRETVDLVYFDPRYAAAWGEALGRQVYESCITGSGPFSHPVTPPGF